MHTIMKSDETLKQFMPRSGQPVHVIGQLVPVYNDSEWETVELLSGKKEGIEADRSRREWGMEKALWMLLFIGKKNVV